MQLVELQKVWDALQSNGIALFAVSYDSVETLAAFARDFDITYPLLSDQGSRVITSLGLLNEQAGEDIAGVPHPGVFVLDEHGVVTDKRFFISYRERETGAGLLEQALGIAAPSHGSEAIAAADVVSVRAWVDSPTFVYSQRLWLTADVSIAPGYHVYGQPIPRGYVPLSIAVEPVERLLVGEPTWPAPAPFRVQGLPEQFYVYEGSLRVALPLTFGMRPVAGDQLISVTVGFQACTAAECLAPSTVRFALPVQAMDEARDQAFGFAPR